MLVISSTYDLPIRVLNRVYSLASGVLLSFSFLRYGD